MWGLEVDLHAGGREEQAADDLLLTSPYSRIRIVPSSSRVAPPTVELGELDELREDRTAVGGVVDAKAGLQAGRREQVILVRESLAQLVAHPDVLQTREGGDRAGARDLRGRDRAVEEHLDAAHLARDPDRWPVLTAAVPRDLVPRGDRAGVQPDVGDAPTALHPVHLEDPPAHRVLGAAGSHRQDLAHRLPQLVHPGTRQGRAEQHRRDLCPGELAGELVDEALGADPLGMLNVVGEELGRGPGEDVGEPLEPVGLRRGPAEGKGVASLLGDVQGHGARHERSQGRVDLPGVGPPAVNLVDEDDGRDRQAPQGGQQHPGAGLHALPRRDHDDRGVQDAQRALHLGDEVRVPGGVDDVDDEVAERHRRDGGSHRDPPLPLHVHRVGLGVPPVDAPETLDDTRLVQ